MCRGRADLSVRDRVTVASDVAEQLDPRVALALGRHALEQRLPSSSLPSLARASQQCVASAQNVDERTTAP